jgi:hypothetical protein
MNDERTKSKNEKERVCKWVENEKGERACKQRNLTFYEYMYTYLSTESSSLCSETRQSKDRTLSNLFTFYSFFMC